ncbi:protein SCAR3 isoform X3 [Alnus glutinosa]|nr:protein SCAR3 isoform X3 [Alnus glutinosa]
MDSYEECRDPPRLHLLDKFDTGGPGSCLKRYSDPTFFKKASVTSGEVTTGKIQIDKKARRSKKKRSSHGSGQLLRGASISNGSSRLQFASPTINGQTSPLQTASAVDMKSNSDLGDHSNSFDSSGLPCTSHIVNRRASPSQTASTVDMTLKSDTGDYSHSFDSRTGSGYIECVFHLSSSMQPEQQESPSSRLMQQNETLDSVFPEEQTKAVDYNSPSNSLQEQIASSSSCVTWDEKAEIVEPRGEQSDGDEAPDMLWMKSNTDSHGGRAVDFTNVDQTDSLLENSLQSISSRNQIDDIESEPDNYMDALNTIESESENDLDSQTKREVERYASCINDEGIDDIHELHVNSADHSPPELESDTASCSSSTEGMPSNISNSISPESFAHEQMVVSDLYHSVEEMPQIAKLSSNLDNSVASDFGGSADVLDGSNLEPVISGSLASASKISDFRDPSRDKIISNFCESQETPGDFSGVHSIKFWTNGGLLGLEPSKPPDYAMPTAVGPDSRNRSKDETVCPSEHSCMLKGDDDYEGEKDILAKRVGGIEKDSSCVCSTSCQDDQEEGVSTKKTDRGLSQAGSDAKCEKFSVMAPKTMVPVAPDMKSISAEASSGNDENSSLVFGLSRRLLANGLSKKVSLVHDDNPELGSSVNAGGLEQCSGQNRVVNQKIPETTFEEQFGHGSPIDSLTSSPPLEHMKISFHPLNGFETSKLKLKFPDGNQCFEGVRDMFPSFQLVPEPDIPLNDFGFESDDDTFCRSSPCKSSDCHSHYSESNSEQWESGETPERKDLELYDALCGISSAESMVSSLELGGMANNGICIDGGTKSVDSRNGVEQSLSGPFLDLPNFDTVNPVLQQETNEDYKLECSGQSTPQPPPLPPVQKHVSKPDLDVTEDKLDDVSETLTHAFDLILLESAVLQQPKPAPAKQQHTNKEAATIEQKSKQQDEQKLNGQKEANQALNGMGMDDREDFLQQIRSKSFNLKSTMSTKPTNTAGPTTNVKVTAILEKANAIRQAVGSDDGDDDDDTWSDA